MSCTISVQPTPNPNALKFVLDVPVKSRDSSVFKKGSTVSQPLAAKLLALKGVTEVFLSGNFITITQDGSADWDALESLVKNVIQDNIATHNPDAQDQKAAVPAGRPDAALAKINDVLDRTIRPALQRDGGDLQLLSLDGKVLTISYQGACGCCPHAAMGTLYAIQNILRDQYDPEIVVEMA